MDTNELVETIEKGFKDLRSEFGGQMDGLRKELGGQMDGLRGEFGDLRKEFGELKVSVAAQIKTGIRQTLVATEKLRDDLKIFDEDSSKSSPIPLARRVTSLEGRVKALEKRR